jgi:multidrug resistance protein, MATE family
VSELKTILRHGGTVLAGQLAVMAFGVADTVIAGRHSSEALAALSVGAALYVSVYVGLIGIVQALLPIWAELRGASKLVELGQSLRQSLYLCALLVVPGMLALLFPDRLLDWAEVPQAMRAEVENYLMVLAAAFGPALLFRVYSTFNQALGKPLLVTWLQVAALSVKIPLSIWWVGGGLGVEPMGVAGCAWATLAVNYLLLVLAGALLATQPLYRRFHVWRRIEAPDIRQLVCFLQLGLPVGLSYFVEVTSFTLMALFIARLGTAASAAHQIAASMAAVMYMVPLSLGIACSARVSFWLGANEARRARKIALLGLTLASTCATLLAAAVMAGREWIAGWYTASPEIARAASALLIWVALYHIADSLQAVSAFLLRCYRVSFTPLAFYALGLWGLGLFGGYRLTYHGLRGGPFFDATFALRSAAGFWIAACAALALVAIALLSLLMWKARKPFAQIS